MNGAANDDESWEVRAFMEDTTVNSSQWPPRSYACSFCKRGFRTAQALGGHMNVHRRERQQAKLAELRKAAASGSFDAVNAAAEELHQHLAPPPKRIHRDHHNAVDAGATSQSLDLPSFLHFLGPATPSRTAELLSPESLSLSLSSGSSYSSGAFPSPESSSSPQSRLDFPADQAADILCETLRLGNASPPYERTFHLHERSVDLAKFATMEEDDDALGIDLELRLGFK